MCYPPHSPVLLFMTLLKIQIVILAGLINFNALADHFELVDVLEDSVGNFYTLFNSASARGTALIKGFKSDGTPIPSSEITLKFSLPGLVSHFELGPDGNFWVLSTIAIAKSTYTEINITLQKVNTDGRVVFTKDLCLNRTRITWADIQQFTVDADGNIYLAGTFLGEHLPYEIVRLTSTLELDNRFGKQGRRVLIQKQTNNDRKEAIDFGFGLPTPLTQTEYENGIQYSAGPLRLMPDGGVRLAIFRKHLLPARYEISEFDIDGAGNFRRVRDLPLEWWKMPFMDEPVSIAVLGNNPDEWTVVQSEILKNFADRTHIFRTCFQGTTATAGPCVQMDLFLESPVIRQLVSGNILIIGRDLNTLNPAFVRLGPDFKPIGDLGYLPTPNLSVPTHLECIQMLSRRRL
jgi:hypothetical protein